MSSEKNGKVNTVTRAAAAAGAGAAGTNSVGEALERAVSAEGAEDLAAVLGEFVGEDESLPREEPAAAGGEGDAGEAGEDGLEAGAEAEGEAQTEEGSEEPEGEAGAGEATEAQAGEGSEDAAAPEEGEEGIPPEVQAKIDKRIAKEVAKRKALEARIAKLEGSGGAARKAGSESGGGGLAEVESLDDLEQLRQQNEQAADWADEQLLALRRNPDGVETELKAAKVVLGEYSPEQMEEYLLGVRAKTGKRLRSEIPKREKFLQARAHADRVAESAFPWWSDPESAEYQEAQTVLEQRPALREMTDYRAAVGVYLVGLHQIRKEIAARKKGNPGAGSGNGNGNGTEAAAGAAARKKAAPKPPALNGGGRNPPGVSGKAVEAATKRKRFAEVGDEESTAAVLEASGLV